MTPQIFRLMISKIKKFKNKYIALIPKKLQNEYGLKTGDELDLTYKINREGPEPRLRIIINRTIKHNPPSSFLTDF